MLITLHTLAQTYGMLPSECLQRASTFDLYVLDCFYKHQSHVEKKAQGGAPPTPKLTQEQMLGMVERVRKNQVTKP